MNDKNLSSNPNPRQQQEECKQVEDKLRESEAKYRTLVEQIPAITYIDTLDAVTIYVSPQIEKMLGFSQEEYLADPDFWLKLLHPDDRERVQAEYRQSRVSGKPFTSEYRLTAQDGRVVWVCDRAVVVQDDMGQPRIIQGVILDITERIQAEKAIKDLAYYDYLTNLPNRLLFNDRFSLELAHAHRNRQMIAIMFIDLDQFKIINDTLGHNMGDQFLKIVAERLKSLLREADTFSRFGGDEFTLLLPQIHQMEDIVKIAQRIIETIRQPWILQGIEFHITVSIGVAVYPRDGDNIETLLKNADTAMYRVKEGGKNNYQFYKR